MGRDDAHTIHDQFKAVLSSHLIEEEESAFILYDFNVLDQRIQEVNSCFGDHAKHTVAVKSNPLLKVLEWIGNMGHGMECASFEEVLLAQKAGASFIAWDSPAKTKSEIKHSNEVEGLLINADSLKELRSIIELNDRAEIALRINPQSETGSHASMTVSGQYSKFGEPISNRTQIIEAIIEAEDRVTGLHVHSSSQTARFEKMSEAIRRVIDLALDINSKRPGTIEFIDIGGGFPTAYTDQENYDIKAYANLLRKLCPELFDGTFRMVTEFGRYYHANAGWTASRMHDVKSFDGHQVVILHVGADLFLREAYNPGIWHHDMIVVGAEDHPKLTTDVGGPLCFGGDYIAKGIELPKAQADGWMIIRDTGANSFSLWSRHCSRSFPKVIGFQNKPVLLKARESFDDIASFWS